MDTVLVSEIVFAGYFLDVVRRAKLVLDEVSELARFAD